MNKTIIYIASLAAAVVLSGCNGASSASAQTSASASAGDTHTTSENANYHRKPGNTPPVAYAGKDRKINVDDPRVNVNAALIPDKDGDKLSYIWTLVKKPVGSNAEMKIKYSTSRASWFIPDEFGKYTVSLLVRDENGGTGADTVTFSTTLEAKSFNMYLGDGINIVENNWKTLSNVNNQNAQAIITQQEGKYGVFRINGDQIEYEVSASNPLPSGKSESATLRIFDDADEITITVYVTKETVINGSFETGDLTGWTAQGGAEVLQKSNFSPSDINASDGNYFLLLSSGFESNGLGAAGDIDGDGVTNYDASNVTQTFTAPTDTVISFDIITFLTDESIGYYDEIFQVLIDGVDVAHGSTPGTDDSPFENFGGSVNYVAYSVSSSGILNGSYFNSGKTNGEHFVIPISAGTHTIKFLVADKGDTIVDTAIVIDNVVLGY